MDAFADASALVEPYADEAHHEVVRSPRDVVIAEVSRVEVVAALWRKTRTRGLSDDDMALLVADFGADHRGSGDEPRRFAVVAAAAPVLEDAATLCARHGLRAYDAVQLASALAAAEVGEPLPVAAFDRQLRSAAVREGLTVVPGRPRRHDRRPTGHDAPPGRGWEDHGAPPSPLRLSGDP